jgi:hypothetical protein
VRHPAARHHCDGDSLAKLLALTDVKQPGPLHLWCDQGLGEDPDRIKKLLRDDLAALAAFEAAIVGKKHIHDGDNVTITPERGNGRAYTLRRLAKDHPELFEQVVAGELSANQAAKQTGFRKDPKPLQQTSA